MVSLVVGVGVPLLVADIGATVAKGFGESRGERKWECY